MRPAAVKALELDPLLAEAHAAMGLRALARARLGERREVVPARHRSQPKSHADLHQLCDLDAYSTGKGRRGGRGSCEEALRADPLSLDVRRELAMVQIIAGRYRGGHRQPPARASSRSRLPVRGFVPRQGPDVRRQAAGGVTPVGRGRKPSQGRNSGWPMRMSWLAAAAEVEKIAAAHDHPLPPGDHLCRPGGQRPRVRGVGPGG